MAQPSQGRPQIIVRLHPDALAMLKERVEAAAPGRRGGLSAYVRQVLYDHLGFESGEREAVPGQ